jgi:hypothetical protein
MTITPERLAVLIASWRAVLDHAVLTDVERDEIADSMNALRELQSARAEIAGLRKEQTIRTREAALKCPICDERPGQVAACDKCMADLIMPS